MIFTNLVTEKGTKATLLKLHPQYHSNHGLRGMRKMQGIRQDAGLWNWSSPQNTLFR